MSTEAAAASALAASPLSCELPDGSVVPYLDLGNGFVAISADAAKQQPGYGSGVSIGIILTGTGMPTAGKYGGVGGGGPSGHATSPASIALRDLTSRARVQLLRQITGTSSVGGSLAKTIPVLGILESFLNFLSMKDAIINAPVCKPLA